MRHTLAIVACGALALTLLGGCKQKQGDRCQMTSDCEDTLVCCVNSGQVVLGGLCYPQDKCGTIAADSGVKDIGQKDQVVTDKAPGDKTPTPDGKTADTKVTDTKAPTSDTKAPPDATGPTPDTTSPTPDTKAAKPDK
jgi:hypothetical protein